MLTQIQVPLQDKSYHTPHEMKVSIYDRTVLNAGFICAWGAACPTTLSRPTRAMLGTLVQAAHCSSMPSRVVHMPGTVPHPGPRSRRCRRAGLSAPCSMQQAAQPCRGRHHNTSPSRHQRACAVCQWPPLVGAAIALRLAWRRRPAARQVTTLPPPAGRRRLRRWPACCGRRAPKPRMSRCAHSRVEAVVLRGALHPAC